LRITTVKQASKRCMGPHRFRLY